MSVTDEYFKLKTKDKDRLFTELFKLKDEKKILEDKIKEIEAQYKSDLIGLKHDLHYELDNGIKFSIKSSYRKGNIDAKALENAGVMVDNYRKTGTTVYTLRVDK